MFDPDDCMLSPSWLAVRSGAPPRKRPAAAERKHVPQRRYAPKTRTGCITCKIRRVKCDEDKPFCKRCTSTGRKCDGYGSGENHRECSQLTTREPLSVALINDCTSDALERRTFDFFRARTASLVSGYFQDEVWDRIVLQRSHREPAVRYAVNALAALHEEKVLRNHAEKEGVSVSLVQTGFPTRQYSKAISEMQNLLTAESVSLDLVLLCALLCIHFEALRECYVPALVHGENAISLLSSSSDSAVKEVDPALVRAVMQIDLQGSIYLGMRVPALPFYTAATDSTLPDSFHNLTQVRDLVNTWTCRLYHFMRTTSDHLKFVEPGNIPLEAIAYSHELQEIFNNLDSLLWDYMQSCGSKFSDRGQHGLGVLRSRTKMNRILAATCLYSEATMYDAYLPIFKEVLTICVYVSNNESEDRRMLSVSLDDGFLNPLFFVATHCRESVVRYQALEQLKKLPTRNGTWHVEMMVLMAEICIEYEEGLCDEKSPSCEAIAEWRRVHSGAVEYEKLPNSQTRVKFTLRTRPNGMDGDWEVFTQAVRCLKHREPMTDLHNIFEYKEPLLTHLFTRPRVIAWP